MEEIQRHESLQNSEIVQFYKNKNVLITGVTGFLGKVLFWKLLDTCDEIGTIYVLLRSKNNQSAEKRLIQLLKSKPFSPKYKYTDLLQKTVAIESDIVKADLGLSQSDRTLLEDRVNIVLHCAASVKFDAPLKDNMRDNVDGTRSILTLCNNIKNLNAFVHVSTAYSNCQARDIDEKILPLHRDIDDVMTVSKILPDDACDKITDKLLEGRPNTYTYTKAIAEHYVAREEGKFPISIVRPSIVISAAEEPIPGWVDGVNGIAGLGSLGAIGVLRTMDWNFYATSDMVPVDFVSNSIICAAYSAAMEPSKKMQIYNMTSGNMNPISWGKFFQLLRIEATDRPTNKMVRPMIKIPEHNRAHPVKFLMTRLFSELLFAYMIDTILALIGYKQIMVKITHKMHRGYRILMPFTTNEWNFNSENLLQLHNSLSTTDQKLFKFDMRDFDWKLQARHTWDGARTQILKEEPCEESYVTARSRQTMVTIIHYVMMAVVLATICCTSFLGARMLRVL